LSVLEVAKKTGGQITTSKNSTVLTIEPSKVRDACKAILETLPEFYHLVTITGFDEGMTIGVLYHFWKGKEFLSIKTSVPKENAILESVSDILPSSILYEAEVKDLLGVEFKGNRIARQRLVLPDAYPVDMPPPLRKEADPEKIRRAMELE
jgi:Ni,Fe-hydrogenase III component G